MKLIKLMFVYLPHQARRGYVYRRLIPKPFIVALHVLCLGRIRRMDLENLEGPAWEQLTVEVADRWCIAPESAHAYFYSKRYSSPAAFSLLDALLEQGFSLLDIQAAIEQHLPCNRDRKFELQAGGCIFNLYLVIPQLPKPRWDQRAARRSSQTFV